MTTEFTQLETLEQKMQEIKRAARELKEKEILLRRKQLQKDKLESEIKQLTNDLSKPLKF